MDIPEKQNEGNQAAGSQEHSETPPDDGLITVLNPASDQITSLLNKMVEFQRQADTEKPNLCQISEAGEELSFLLSLKELIGNQLKNIQLQNERESELVISLQIQVSLSNQERDEMIEKYKSEAVKLSESKSIICDLLKDKELIGNQLKNIQLQNERESELVVSLQVQVSLSNQERDEMIEKYKSEAVKLSESKSIICDLLKDKEDLSQQLRVSQNETLMEKAEHLRSKEAFEAKIKSLSLTNENLISDLNDVKKQLSLQEKPWRKKYTALDTRYQMKLDKSIKRMRETTQTCQRILENKFKAVLNRNNSLLAQLKVACNEHTLLEDSHQLLINANQRMVNEVKRVIDERTVLLEERTLLEDICLMLKKKCRGIFGRRMQGRDFELAKMKRKMQETQAVMQT